MPYCVDSYCLEDGERRFCGYCLYCWTKLPESRRQRLLEAAGLPEIERVIITRLKPRSRLRTLLLLSWRLGVTAAVVADLWGKWRHR